MYNIFCKTMSQLSFVFNYIAVFKILVWDISNSLSWISLHAVIWLAHILHHFLYVFCWVWDFLLFCFFSFDHLFSFSFKYFNSSYFKLILPKLSISWLHILKQINTDTHTHIYQNAEGLKQIHKANQQQNAHTEVQRFLHSSLISVLPAEPYYFSRTSSKLVTDQQLPNI